MATSPDPLAVAWSSYRAGDLPERPGPTAQSIQENPAKRRRLVACSAIVSRALGQPDEAVRAYQGSAAATAELCRALNNLGNDLVNQEPAGRGRLPPSSRSCAFDLITPRRTTTWPRPYGNSEDGPTRKPTTAKRSASSPTTPTPQTTSGSPLTGLGTPGSRGGQLPPGRCGYARDYADAHTNLGTGVTRLGRLDEALARTPRGQSACGPATPKHTVTSANTHVAGRRYTEAEACYREGAAPPNHGLRGRSPTTSAPRSPNRASSWKLSSANGEAARLRPDYPEACGNLATAPAPRRASRTRRSPPTSRLLRAKTRFRRRTHVAGARPAWSWATGERGW